MNELRVLKEFDIVDLPDSFLDKSLMEIAVYAMVQEEEPVVPARIRDWYDASPGSLYPALDTLEEDGLIERRPALEGGGQVAETVGPEIC